MATIELIETEIPATRLSKTVAVERKADPLSWLLPRIIGLLLLTDILFRFLPFDLFCFRAWEYMTRYQEPGAIFQANAHFQRDRTYGNLANIANLPKWRQYRPQQFTTDAHGFRNPPLSMGGPVAALFVGDSFLAGDAVSDGDTLTAQLSALTGLQFYNAGGPYAYATTVRLLKGKLGLKQGRVIVVQTQGVSGPMLRDAELGTRGSWGARMFRTLTGAHGDRVRSWIRGWWYVSPLRILLQRGYMALSNDRILPNVYADEVIARRLRSGDTMLFYRPEVEAYQAGRDLADVAEYLAGLATTLKEEGFDLAVVLAPNKYSVYHSLLANGINDPPLARHPYVQLAERLTSSGLDVLNLTPQLQACAARQAGAGQYLYWLDDTHWNRDGIAVAARSIQQAWFPSENAQPARDVCADVFTRVAK